MSFCPGCELGEYQISKLEVENERLVKLNKLREEYTKLICNELDEIVSFASSHGWKSTRYEKGKEFRDKIKILEDK